MQKIKLKNSPLYAIIDNDDLGLISNHEWYLAKRRKANYAATAINGRLVLMHRLILGLKTRLIHADHINSNGLDNRRSNLRTCTAAENNRNRGAYKNNRVGFKGVSETVPGKRWNARITIDKKLISLGSFHTPELAARAYDRAARLYHGEFANLNFK